MTIKRMPAANSPWPMDLMILPMQQPARSIPRVPRTNCPLVGLDAQAQSGDCASDVARAQHLPRSIVRAIITRPRHSDPTSDAANAALVAHLKRSVTTAGRAWSSRYRPFNDFNRRLRCIQAGPPGRACSVATAARHVRERGYIHGRQGPGQPAKVDPKTRL